MAYSLLLCTSMLSAQSSIYNFQILSINGTDSIQLNNYQGKKILFVNIACLSTSVNQIAGLEELYQRFKDSGLVIIACPSNSFQNEPGSNQEIKQFCASRFSCSFLISEKIDVLGSNTHPLYQWLSSKAQNSVMNINMKGNFTKILVNRQGLIVGFFAEQVGPTDDIVISTIRNN